MKKPNLVAAKLVCIFAPAIVMGLIGLIVSPLVGALIFFLYVFIGWFSFSDMSGPNPRNRKNDKRGFFQ